MDRAKEGTWCVVLSGCGSSPGSVPLCPRPSTHFCFIVPHRCPWPSGYMRGHPSNPYSVDSWYSALVPVRLTAPALQRLQRLILSLRNLFPPPSSSRPLPSSFCRPRPRTTLHTPLLRVPCQTKSARLAWPLRSRTLNRRSQAESPPHPPSIPSTAALTPLGTRRPARNPRHPTSYLLYIRHIHHHIPLPTSYTSPPSYARPAWPHVMAS